MPSWSPPTAVHTRAFGDPLYRDVVERTLAFVEREMTSPEGGLLQRPGRRQRREEGLFYVWTKEELEAVLGDDLALATDYYSINAKGLWEKGPVHPAAPGGRCRIREVTGHGPRRTFRTAVARINDKLSRPRKRKRPGLDDKALTSWSALMVQGYCDAYAAFGPAYRDAAVRNMDLLLGKCRREMAGCLAQLQGQQGHDHMATWRTTPSRRRCWPCTASPSTSAGCVRPMPW